MTDQFEFKIGDLRVTKLRHGPASVRHYGHVSCVLISPILTLNVTRPS